MASPLDALGRRSSAASRKAKQESQRLTAAGIVCDEVDGLEKGSGMAVELRRCFFLAFSQLLVLLNRALQSTFQMGPVAGCLQTRVQELKKSPIKNQ